MKKGSLILFAIGGLLILSLVTAAISLDSVGFNRFNATPQCQWLDTEGILSFEDYKSARQQLNYDLLHVLYDGISENFANTTFGDAVPMGPWPAELDDHQWDAEITGRDFLQVMMLIPTIGTTDQVTALAQQLQDRETVTVAQAAEYIYAVFHECIINYAELDNLDQLDEYLSVILDKQYLRCSFLYTGDNSMGMVLNAVRAAVLDHGQHTLSYSTEETETGVLFRLDIGY